MITCNFAELILHKWPSRGQYSSRARIHRPPSASAHLHGLSLYSNMGNFRISACLCPRGTDVMHILHYRTCKSQENSPPELKVSGAIRCQAPPPVDQILTPRRTPKSLKFGMVQISQIPGNTICGFVGCGSHKSEGFGDGCTALRVLPSPSCA